MITEWRAVDPEVALALESMEADAFFSWLEQPTGDVDVLDLDKEWHALHAVLTGTAWDVDVPRGRAVLGGDEFGEDAGYGPPRLLSEAAVAEVADELEAFGDDRCSAAIDPDRMAALEVYPSGIPWGHPDERRYLVDSFAQLRAFYRRAADAGRSVVILIT